VDVLAINLGARIYYTLCMVREARKMNTIFLALQLLRMFAFFAIIDLKGVVAARNDREFTGIVKIKGSDGSSRATRFKAL
jgi:hypothetical protein